MKIAVVGSRNFKNIGLITTILDGIIPTGSWSIDTIVTGGAIGVDTVAMNWAKKNNVELEVFYALWDEYGKKAGPLRNQQIVLNSDIVFIFWDGVSPGTKSTINYCMKHKKDFRVYFDGE